MTMETQDGDNTGVKNEDDTKALSSASDPSRLSGGETATSNPKAPCNLDPVIGSPVLRPVFLANLHVDYTPEDVQSIFETPILPEHVTNIGPVPVDRVDLKRGYCFVFLKDATSQTQKEQTERFVSVINGMRVPKVSDSLRAEFARGDGRVKRKEDERRKNINPSDTLFVVNFNEVTTKRDDLQQLFEPFGELIRIDMKRNYAFVQFKTIEQATAARTEINGGKLDQSILTVEYVARPRMDELRRSNSGGGGRGGDRRGPPRQGRGGFDDRGRGRNYNGPPPHRGGSPAYGDRVSDRDRPPRYDRDRGFEERRGSRSPPSNYRRRSSRSRSRSPIARFSHRDRSPLRGRYDERPEGYGAGGGRHASSPLANDRARDTEGVDPYHRDRDRGYRS